MCKVKSNEQLYTLNLLVVHVRHIVSIVEVNRKSANVPSMIVDSIAYIIIHSIILIRQSLRIIIRWSADRGPLFQLAFLFQLIIFIDFYNHLFFNSSVKT